MTADTPPVLYISADTSGLTTRYKAEPRMHPGADAWVRMPEAPSPKWVNADDMRRFVISFHDLQRAHLIAGLADIDHVDAMWMTICMDCEPAALPAPDEGEQEEGE
jgi:hypothetical protein